MKTVRFFLPILLALTVVAVIVAKYWSAESEDSARGAVELREVANASAPDADVVVDDVSIRTPPFSLARREVESRVWENDSGARVAPAPDVMPPMGAPLSDSLDTLKELAKSGNGTAACRLLTEGLTCLAAANSSSFRALMEGGMSSSQEQPTDSLMIDLIVRGEQRAEAKKRLCAGIDVDDLTSFDEYVSAAINAMTPRQKVVLAMTRHDGSLVRLPRSFRGPFQSASGPTTEYVIPDVLRAEQDMRFLEAGIEAGDPLALEGLILVHAPGWIPGSEHGMRVRFPDPYRFAGFALVAVDLFGPDFLGEIGGQLLDRVLQQIPPDGLDALQKEVATEVARWRSTGSLIDHMQGDGSGASGASELCQAPTR